MNVLFLQVTSEWSFDHGDVGITYQNFSLNFSYIAVYNSGILISAESDLPTRCRWQGFEPSERRDSNLTIDKKSTNFGR